jgi:type II secretory pathway pseudopilin PulG
MPYSPFRRKTPDLLFDRSGMTWVEALILVGIVVILGMAAFSPVSDYLEKIRISHAVEKVRTINTLLSQYATDNNGVYPAGEGTTAAGRSEGIARNLLDNNYTPDASIFALGGSTKYSGSAPDFSDLKPENISWDFTGGATPSTGITTAASDSLPTIFTTGEEVIYPPPGAGLDLPLSGKGPFGNKCIVVAYKYGGARLIIGAPLGGTVKSKGFISKAFKDTATYTQIKP